ncbi:MAG: hypothetical protein K2F81_08440 [Ruminococcus sp.]|nr:hypothetical protein [Ruminococcus sp.]
MKKSIILILFCFLFSSCNLSSQNNSVNTKVSNKKFILSDISEIYNGISKDINNSYTKITIPNNVKCDPPEKLYELTMKYQNDNKDLNYANERAKRLNEIFCSKNNIQKKTLSLSETNLDFFTLNDCTDYAINCSVFGEFNCFLEKTYDNIYNASELNIVRSYYLNRDKSGLKDSYMINNKNITIENIVESVENFINNDLKLFSLGIDARVKDIYIVKYDKKYAFKCIMERVLDDVPFLECNTMNYEKFEEGTDHFILSYLEIIMTNSNIFDVINNYIPLKLGAKKEISQVIPLKEAMNILEQELADNVHFNIDEVSLVYCCKQGFHAEDGGTDLTLDSFDSSIRFEYSPYWCFYIDDNDNIAIGNEHPRKCLMVDALKGDLSVLI